MEEFKILGGTNTLSRGNISDMKGGLEFIHLNNLEKKMQMTATMVLYTK